MSDETPAGPGPSAEEPITANPVEQPTGPTAPPVAEAPGAPADASSGAGDAGEGADGPTEANPAEPTEAPAAASSDAGEAPEAPEAPTEANPVEPAEAPTEVAPAPAASGAAAPVAAAPAGTTTERRRGVFVPAWVAVVLGVLLVAGLGFLIGWIAAPSDDSSPSNAAATTPAFPNGNGNGQNVPTLPNGNGNGNGNGSSNGSDAGDGSDNPRSIPTQSRAYLGVTLAPSSDDGATIGSVAEDSPAADAGLKAGDVITEVDGDTVSSPLDAVRAIRAHDPDDSVTITYSRNGTSNTVKVTLAETPSESPS